MPRMFLLLAGILALPTPAAAASVIRQPGRHDSSIELELHGIVRWHDRVARYGGAGAGVGFRLGIPLVRNGFIRSLNNSVSINFGADLLTWHRTDFAANLILPAALQWNFFVAPRWSVFGEAGIALEWFPSGESGRGRGRHLGLWPGPAIGGRFHFARKTGFPTLTVRAGFPSGLNAGISF